MPAETTVDFQASARCTRTGGGSITTRRGGEKLAAVDQSDQGNEHEHTHGRYRRERSRKVAVGNAGETPISMFCGFVTVATLPMFDAMATASR
jgi:hypothetical protein